MFWVFFLISLLVIPDICSQKWEVQYSKTAICALKGSTVLLSASYKHPDGLTVKEIFWTVNPDKKTSINLLNHPDYIGRVDFFKSQERTFVLKLSNVTHEDEGQYCLRIVTNVEKERYLFYPGVELTVTDLRVETPKEVVEGDSPVLTCKSSCNLGSTNFSWYKNGEPYSESERQNQLLLQSVSSEDAGNYSCAVRDQKHLPSPALTLNVRYPPRNVSVSGSAVIVSGDSVTLSCSSDSNPPAVNFSWFKDNQSSAVGSGQSFSISSFNSSHSGRYYCEAHNNYGSQRSASVSLTATDGQNTLPYTAAVGFGAAFICICICTIIVALKIIRRNTADAEVQGDFSKQENKNTSVMDQVDTCDPDTGLQNDVMYASVSPKRPKKHQTAEEDDDVQYASVHHIRNAGKKSSEAESQYGNMSNCRSDDFSVIYSSVGVA